MSEGYDPLFNPRPTTASTGSTSVTSKPPKTPTSSTTQSAQATQDFDISHSQLNSSINSTTSRMDRSIQDPLARLTNPSESPADPLSRSSRRTGSQEGPQKILSTFRSFFAGSVPADRKVANINDIPAGIEGVPFVLKHECYSKGIEAMHISLKRAQSNEEKLFFRFFKTYFLIRLRMYDKANLEFEAIGPIDKIITQDSSKESSEFPYNIRLLNALNPYISKVNEERTLERLHLLFEFCKKKSKSETITEGYEEEKIDIESICDINISDRRWKSRCLFVATLIIELLLEKNEINATVTFIDKIKEFFHEDLILMSYLGRSYLMKGEKDLASQAFNKVKEQEGETSIKYQFNSSIEQMREGKIDEARKGLVVVNSQTQDLQVSCNNNIAYLLSMDGEIKGAIELLENTLKSNPYAMNEVLIQNLIVLYDFYYPDSRDKKKVIEDLVETYARDGFNRQVISNLWKV